MPKLAFTADDEQLREGFCFETSWGAAACGEGTEGGVSGCECVAAVAGSDGGSKAGFRGGDV